MTVAATITADAAHVRHNQGILFLAEKRLLVWLAARMPAPVNSDHLTVLGLAGMLGAGLSLWAVRIHPGFALVAIAGLAVNWFGDSLDGTLARVRNHQRPRYGYYVDHVVDVFGAVFLLAGLALSGLMSPLIGGLVMLTYLMLIAEIYLATHALGTFRMSFWRLGPTETRILLAIGLARAAADPDVALLGHTSRLFDVGGAITAVVLLAVLLVSVARNTRTLAAAEPLPR